MRWCMWHVIYIFCEDILNERKNMGEESDFCIRHSYPRIVSILRGSHLKYYAKPVDIICKKLAIKSRSNHLYIFVAIMSLSNLEIDIFSWNSNYFTIFKFFNNFLFINIFTSCDILFKKHLNILYKNINKKILHIYYVKTNLKYSLFYWRKRKNIAYKKAYIKARARTSIWAFKVSLP